MLGKRVQIFTVSLADAPIFAALPTLRDPFLAERGGRHRWPRAGAKVPPALRTQLEAWHARSDAPVLPPAVLPGACRPGPACTESSAWNTTAI